MYTSATSALTAVVMFIIIFGGMGLYYVLVLRQRTSPDSRSADLAASGYRPGEGILCNGVGDLLVIDERDNLGRAFVNVFDAGGATQVRTSLTTHGRLLVEANGQRSWFDQDACPTIRTIGRMMVKDTTGLLHALANQSDATSHFVRAGRAKPPGAHPKRLYNDRGLMEDVHVIELSAHGRAPLRFEAVESVVVALYQWAQGGGRMSMAPQPFSTRAAPTLTA